MATREIGRKHQRTETGRGTRMGRGSLGIPGSAFVLLMSIPVPACDTADREVPEAALVAFADPTGNNGSDDTTLVDLEAFEDAFEVSHNVVLEESDEAMTVLPMVSPGLPGEFLLAEPQEGQVNVYDTAGRLRRVLGRRGEGPGEFRTPIAARRLLDGGIVVADAMRSRLTFFPAGDGGEPEVVASPLPLVLDAQDLGGGRHLLSGQVISEQPPRLLHIWDRRTDKIERSFLPIGVPEESRAYAASYTSVGAVLEGDTIWAVWALSDTLYKFDRDGGILEKLPLSLPRPMGALPGAEAGVITDPRAIRAAAETLTQVNGVFILEDGALVVQTMQARGFDAEWGLLVVNRRGGETVWRAARMPRLYAVLEDLFYFDDPASLLPNHWIAARWRGEVAR